MNPEVLEEMAVRYFMEVVHTGSVSAAAVRLGVAPSAVSRQIARLEHDLGTLLFERKARGMTPNSAGQVLAAHAKRAHRDVERVTSEILALRGVRAGTIRLLCSLGYAADVVPALVIEFGKRHSGIRFILESGPTRFIPQRIANGEADVALTLGLTSHKDVKVEARMPAPVVAVMASSHPLSRRKSLALSEVIAYPIALQQSNSLLRQLIDISLSRQQLRCEPVFSSHSVEALLGFAKLGGGIAFSGNLAVKGMVARGEVVAIPLKDREMNERHFEIQTSAGRSPSPACKAFIDFAIAQLKASPT